MVDFSKTSCDNFNREKGKDKRHILNWRPISLINVDAKVVSKCLALRLRKVIHTLVDSHQTAYVPGRSIRESVKLVEDLLEYAEKDDLTGILFCSDFEKAFDSVDHRFMFACLRKVWILYPIRSVGQDAV